mmetsp:Transcript_100904/g.291828  ORF Transcript_100904/g.291828 Transcript_100904/m.291828 type:complete len:455 (-) Transcript_100904:1059-2423(-)
MLRAGQNRLRVELHRSHRQRLVLDAHDDWQVAADAVGNRVVARRTPGGSRGYGRDNGEILGQWPLRVERVVPCHAEARRQAVEDRPQGVGGDVHNRRLAMHRVVELAQLAAEVLDDALQPEADPKDRDLAFQQLVDDLRHTEVLGATRAGTEDGQVDLRRVAQGQGRGGVPDSRHGGARLAHIVRECVHKGILEVDEQHLLPGATEIGRRDEARRPRQGSGARDRVEASGGLQLCLLLLRLGDAVEQQSRTGTDLGNAVVDANGPQGQAGVQVPIEGDMSHGGAIPPALRLLLLLDKLHRPCLRRAADCDRPHVAQKCIQGVELWTQVALDVVHGVDESAIHLDLPPTDDLHRAVLADTGLVVAVHVGAHGDLRLLLRVGEDGLDVLRILQSILAALDSTADRARLHSKPLCVALNADKHLRGRADEELVLAEVHQEAVRRRIPLLQAIEDRAR